MKFNFKDQSNFNRISKLNQVIYDYIIIGSGPAGVSLYKKLYNNRYKKKILMIEKGDFLNNKYKKIYSKQLPIKLNSRVFAAGGSSNTWSNISSYFEKFEMKSRWEKNSRNLWPLKHEDLISEYNDLKKILGFNFEKIKKKNFNFPFQIRPFVGSAQPKNFKELIKFDEIDFMYNCEVDFINENNKVAIAYTKKKNISFKGKNLIICSGGISSVNLIQKSLLKKKI